ncbi:hypothetical protein CDD83_9 [Cordyceps sp. RAO-2017]|nr:hypothetical protein CDD83_9 [Cordyceps sp. RAO-2017]
MQLNKLYLISLLAGAVSANRHCGKNAWIAWDVDRVDGNSYHVNWRVTSGKDGHSIPAATVVTAFGDCANSRSLCRDSGSGMWCDRGGQHIENGMHGTGNIEFSCSDGPYTCYDFKW